MARQRRQEQDGTAPAGGKVAIGLRIAPALRRKLNAAAVDGGRSLAQEAVLRLEKSFWPAPAADTTWDDADRLIAAQPILEASVLRRLTARTARAEARAASLRKLSLAASPKPPRTRG